MTEAELLRHMTATQRREYKAALAAREKAGEAAKEASAIIRRIRDAVQTKLRRATKHAQSETQP